MVVKTWRKIKIKGSVKEAMYFIRYLWILILTRIYIQLLGIMLDFNIMTAIKNHTAKTLLTALKA